MIHGFMPGRSPVTNAMQHIGYEHTLSMDMADFFDTVTPEMVGQYKCCDHTETRSVYRVHVGRPPVDGENYPIIDNVAHVRVEDGGWTFIDERSNVRENRINVYCEIVGDALMISTPYPMGFLRSFLVGNNVPWSSTPVFVDGAARQGLPTSPAVANLAACPMDKQIAELRSIHGHFTYTRYADDLAISCNDDSVLRILKANIPIIASRNGFKINDKKTHMQRASVGRRRITGVAVGRTGIHVPRRTRRALRSSRHKVRIRGGRKLEAKAKGLAEWCRLVMPRKHERQFTLGLEESQKAWDSLVEETKK